MMTIEKFKQAASEYQRRVVVSIGLAAATAFGWMLACFGLADLLDLRQVYASSFGEPAAEALLGLSLFPAVLALFAVLWYGCRRAEADPRLRCPSCDKVLANAPHIVVATRNCPFCGRKVLEEPAPLP